MQLLGRYLSPFVRRVATTAQLYGVVYDHVPLQHTGEEAARLREVNPVGRVPALVLDDGQVIVDSAACIDYLDRLVGPERALTPADGEARNRAMSLTGIATGSIEKAISVVYEGRFRPEEKRHAPWVERCEAQCVGGLRYLDSVLVDDWFLGDRMSQVDVTTAIGMQFMAIASPSILAAVELPNLDALVGRVADLPAFTATYPG